MFITFEGGEGSGKTTQIKRVVHYLDTKGLKCFITREPGGTEIGEQIRRILQSSKNKGIVPETEMLLFVADRVQHVKELIEPVLQDGGIVLCDRYMDSTYAYQVVARNLNLKLVKHLHKIFKIPKPDKTFLMDVPPSLGLSRAQGRLEETKSDVGQNRFEEEALSFHQALREGYLSLVNEEPERFFIIDAKFPEERVWQRIKMILNTLF